MSTTPDQLERILAFVQRCDRIASFHPDDTVPSHDLLRMIAELRAHLGACPEHAPMAQSLLVSSSLSIEALRLTLGRVRGQITDHLKRTAA